MCFRPSILLSVDEAWVFSSSDIYLPLTPKIHPVTRCHPTAKFPAFLKVHVRLFVRAWCVWICVSIRECLFVCVCGECVVTSVRAQIIVCGISSSGRPVVSLQAYQFRPSVFFEFSYTTQVMLSAGATLRRFGVKPLYSPRYPSRCIVFCVTSHIPV